MKILTFAMYRPFKLAVTAEEESPARRLLDDQMDLKLGTTVAIRTGLRVINLEPSEEDYAAAGVGAAEAGGARGPLPVLDVVSPANLLISISDEASSLVLPAISALALCASLI